jgi:hypothetical protein
MKLDQQGGVMSGTLLDLVGSPLIDIYDGDKPLRPRAMSQAPTTQYYFQQGFQFEWKDYQGELRLGWAQPRVRKDNRGRIVERFGWQPNVSHSLWRPMPGYDSHETHHQWMADLRDEEFLEAIGVLLNPALGLSNRSYVYRITPGFIDSYESYLERYFQRADVLQRIAEFAEAYP